MHYQNGFDKACFQHDMAHGDFKDLNKRTAAYKVFHDKAFDIAKYLKYDRCQRGLASMVYRFFDKKTSGGTAKNENISNKELVEELQKRIIKRFSKRKVNSPFIDNIWSADLVDMKLISKFYKGFRFLLCVIDIYGSCALVIYLLDKKGITITNAFHKILDESNHKPKKIWVDKGSKFYNRSMKPFLQNNDIEMYSMYNKVKSGFAKGFIRT